MTSSRILVASIGVVLLSVLVAPAARAAVIPADVSASGSITYDTINSTSTSPGTHSGTMTATEGGTATNSGFANGSAGGTNPLNATFTDTGDGFAISATGSTGAYGYTLGGVDLNIDLLNSSATTWYEVVVKVVYTQGADADGSDSYLGSYLFLERSSGSTILDSETYSDTLFGDYLNGSDTGTYGASITDSDTIYASLILSPGASRSVLGDWTMEGQEYAGSTAAGSAALSVTLDSVVVTTPEPTGIVLFGLGLLGLAGARRWRRRARI